MDGKKKKQKNIYIIITIYSAKKKKKFLTLKTYKATTMKNIYRKINKYKSYFLTLFH